MIQRQQLIDQKLRILSVKRTLRQLSGIDVIKIFEDDENTALNDMYSAYVPFMCSPETMPCSRISYKSTEQQVISWIAANMELKENTEYFFMCHGTWVQIRVLDLYHGIQSLWKHQGTGFVGFMLADYGLTRMMEVSFDSRDEDHYLLDIWEYAK